MFGFKQNFLLFCKKSYKILDKVMNNVKFIIKFGIYQINIAEFIIDAQLFYFEFGKYNRVEKQGNGDKTTGAGWVGPI